MFIFVGVFLDLGSTTGKIFGNSLVGDLVGEYLVALFGEGATCVALVDSLVLALPIDGSFLGGVFVTLDDALDLSSLSKVLLNCSSVCSSV